MRRSKLIVLVLIFAAMLAPAVSRADSIPKAGELRIGCVSGMYAPNVSGPRVMGIANMPTTPSFNDVFKGRAIHEGDGTSWGLRCKEPWAVTSCTSESLPIKTLPAAGTPPVASPTVSIRDNGCYSTNYEYPARGMIYITCCAVVSSGGD